MVSGSWSYLERFWKGFQLQGLILKVFLPRPRPQELSLPRCSSRTAAGRDVGFRDLGSGLLYRLQSITGKFQLSPVCYPEALNLQTRKSTRLFQPTGTKSKFISVSPDPTVAWSFAVFNVPRR